MLAAADALEAARDELCRLDAPAGDGDHGVTMALAARAVRRSLDEAPDAGGADLLTRVAMAVASVGGASGPLYSAALLAIATTLRQNPRASLAELAAAAETSIVALGHARPGDKTVLDALHPAVEALREGGNPRAAAEAAGVGAASTAQMIATVGRARALGERGRGFADPGATSLAIIIEAAANAYLAHPPRSGARR